jgi:hypothetical protein
MPIFEDALERNHPADLAAELAALARARYSVLIAPRVTPYGVMLCDVTIAPLTLGMGTRTDEITDARPVQVIRLTLDLVAPLQNFADELRDARVLLLMGL